MPPVVKQKYVRISVYGMGAVMQKLYVRDAYIHAKAGAALRQGAGLIRNDARRRISSGGKHKWKGDLNRAIRVGPLKRRPMYMRIKVGPAHKSASTKPSGLYAVYPGAHTFEYGWHGKSHSQPPSEPIKLWLKDKFNMSEKDAKHKSYMIARSIGKHGYKSVGAGGNIEYMRDAANANAANVVTLVATAIATP